MKVTRAATLIIFAIICSSPTLLHGIYGRTYFYVPRYSSQQESSHQMQLRAFMDDMHRQTQVDQNFRRQQEQFKRAVAEITHQAAAAQAAQQQQDPSVNKTTPSPTQPSPQHQSPTPRQQAPSTAAKPSIASPVTPQQSPPQPAKQLPAEQPKPIKKDPPVDPLAQQRKEWPLFFNNAAVAEVVTHCRERAAMRDDELTSKTLQERAETLSVAAKNQTAIVREQKFPPHVYEAFPRAVQFDSFRGNAVSAQLHDELRDVVQAAAALAENATVAPAVKAHADGIFTFCELAAQQRNPDVAFALAEVGMNLLLAAQATQTALMTAQEQVDKLLIAQTAGTRTVPRVKPVNYQSSYEQLTEKINAPLIRAARALHDAYEAARRERTATSAVEPTFELAPPQDRAALAADIIKNFAPFPPCARPEALEGNARNDNTISPRESAAEHEKMLLALQASIDEQAARAQKIVALLEDMRAVEEQRTWVTKDYFLRRNGARPYRESVRAHSAAENEIITQPLKAVLEEVFLHAYPSRHPSGSSGRAQGGGATWSSSSCPAPARLNCVPPSTALVLRSDASSRLEGYARGPEDPEEPDEQKEFQLNQPPEPPSFHNREYLHQLAQKYVKQLAEIKTSHPSYTQYHIRLADRNRGLLGSLDLCGEVQEQSEKFSDEVYTQFPEAHAFDEFSGNAAERVLHNELRENIQLATEAAVQFRDEAYIQAQIPAVFAFTDLARQQENPEAAFSFSDAGFHLLNAAKKFGSELMKVPIPQVFLIGMILKGGAKAVERSIDLLAEYRSHPIQSVARDACAIYILGYKALKVGYTLIFGPPEARHALQAKAKDLALYLKDNPDEWAALAIQMRFCPTPLSALRAAQKCAAALYLKRAMDREAAWARSFRDGIKQVEREYLVVHEVATPEGMVLQCSGDIVRGRGSSLLGAAKSAEENTAGLVPLAAGGSQKAGNLPAFKLLTQPTATITEKAIVSAVRMIEKAEVVEEAKIVEAPETPLRVIEGAAPALAMALARYDSVTLPAKEAINHFFHPELNIRKRPTGMHSLRYNEHLVVPGTLTPPDKNGVSVGLIYHNGWYKMSDLAPAHLNEAAFESMLRQAWENLDQKSLREHWITGYTQEGIPIDMAFNQDKISGLPYIGTAYLRYSGDEEVKRSLAAEAKKLNDNLKQQKSAANP